MIELIRTYAGYSRPEGRVKQTFAGMFRCSKCEEIKDSIKELREKGCTHEFKTAPTTTKKNKV